MAAANVMQILTRLENGKININRHELLELVRTLKDKDCCFTIMVESADGEKVQVHN